MNTGARKNKKKSRRRAVFLDRDGTINREVDVLRDIRELRILPGAAQAIGRLNRLGFLVIVVTNQPVIARGWLKEKEIDEIHALMLRRLKRGGAKLDAIYYCPHHPNANLKRYRLECRCRKPNTGMVRDAIQKFHLDPRRSFMIGDTSRDILTGKRAKLRTILVETGYAGKDGKYDVKPDFTVRNLGEAARIIEKSHAK